MAGHPDEPAPPTSPGDRRQIARASNVASGPIGVDLATGLHNRAALELLLDSGRVRRDRRNPMCCALIGIDDLTAVHEVHGEPGAQRALRSVADELRALCTRADLLFRYDHDQILVLRSSVDLADGWVWAEHARARIRDTRIGAAHADIAVTISIGLHALPPTQVTTDVLGLLEGALAVARERGGSRVCTWESVVIDRACDFAATAAPGAPIGARAELLRRIEPRIGPWQRILVEDHAERTAALSLAIARQLGVGREHWSRLRTIAILSTIGTLTIPETLLAKPEALTRDELSVVRTAGDAAARIAQRLGLDDATAECARLAGARYDGAGDTADALGAAQPADARIVAVASAAASMACARPHRGPMTASAVVRELHAQAGRQFAPEAVQAACEVIATMRNTRRRAA